MILLQIVYLVTCVLKPYQLKLLQLDYGGKHAEIGSIRHENINPSSERKPTVECAKQGKTAKVSIFPFFDSTDCVKIDGLCFRLSFFRRAKSFDPTTS